MTDLYHRGQVAVQELAGERSQAILNGRIVWTAIPAAARSFVSRQSSVAIGWLDASGHAWASVLGGQPGFASCDDGGAVVTIRSSATAARPGTLQAGIRGARSLGMLFIDLATRRRLRVNGVVERSADGNLRVLVEQAFPNCPKYIQRREPITASGRPLLTAISSGPGLPTDLHAWLSRTDTAFVTSVGPEERIDCSHRGGRPGFMRLDGDAVLVPDYPGNSMFCTLGNITVDPRAALVLIDFDERRQLHLSGEASVELASADHPEATGGTGRWWRLKARRWAVSPLADAVSWRLVDASPFNPPVEP